VVVGRALEKELADLRRDNSLGALPAHVVNTLNMLVAEGRAACAPPQITGPDPANGATTETMLTTRDVHEMLGKTRQRVRQLAESGELPAVKEDGSWRFDPADVIAYQERRSGSGQTTTGGPNG
jgi:hypothetical protein